MRSTEQIIERLEALKTRHAARDLRHQQVLCVRAGDYDRIAGDLMPEGLDKPLVSNLVDTAARDVSEVMAPLPTFSCSTSSQTSNTAKAFHEKRGQILNGYVTRSRLQDQMFKGADRYVTFGFMALIAEPDFTEQSPVIRVDNAPHAYYVVDGRGRVKEYVNSAIVPISDLALQFPDYAPQIRTIQTYNRGRQDMELVCYWDDDVRVCLLPEIKLELVRAPNLIHRCPVAVVERPSITGDAHGQFDDVIWVQIARAMIQMYTMSALEQSVNAPLVLPNDVNELELGPLSTIQTDNPAGVGRVPLQIPQGVFPSAEILLNEQRVGSRYPEGRSGSIDASVVTGQGVEALMGTFDTQIQTFQRLMQVALEDLASFCFEMDERVWPNVTKTVRVKDTGAPYQITYTPAKDIRGDYTSDITYGAIAGLDPNRGLVFILQTLGGGLISKDSARRHMPVDIDPIAEEEQIAVEAIRESLLGTVATLPQMVPPMMAQGGDGREIILQVAEILSLVQKGQSIDEAVKKVLAPKQEEQPATPAGLPPGPGGGGVGQPQTPGQDLLMSLAGLTPGGNANLQANVSRRTPI